MSTTPPSEPPTRRLAPAYERVVEPAVAPVDPNLLFVRLEDAIASLRTALVFVGILAVLAVGLSIYAITRDDSSPAARSGAVTSERVAQLDDRIDRLSRQLQQARADARAARDLPTRVDALSRSVSALRTQAGSGAAATDATQALQDLGKRVDSLEQQVQDLGQGQTTP